MRKGVTLKDIATKTGYSINTVSHAIRGIDDIAEDTRIKIKKTAEELGYIENTIAQSMRLGYTMTIAGIIGDMSNPHFSILMKEIEQAAAKEGYTLFILNTDEDEDKELQAIKIAIHRSVDGIIICPTQKSDRNIEVLEKSGVPFVLIGRRSYHIDTSYCVCDDVQGGYIATEYLIKHGHRKILMLTGPAYISSASERKEGYRKALEAYGIAYDEKLVIEVPIITSDCTHILSLYQRLGFTAVFAFSDVIAWNLWKCLKEHGIAVPEDVSIIGFDHIQSRLSLPISLTSVATYKAKMSITATDILINLIQKNYEKKQVIVKTSIAEGESIGWCRKL